MKAIQPMVHRIKKEIDFLGEMAMMIVSQRWLLIPFLLSLIKVVTEQ
jgi:hypothetical protein